MASSVGKHKKDEDRFLFRFDIYSKTLNKVSFYSEDCLYHCGGSIIPVCVLLNSSLEISANSLTTLVKVVSPAAYNLLWSSTSFLVAK